MKRILLIGFLVISAACYSADSEISQLPKKGVLNLMLPSGVRTYPYEIHGDKITIPLEAAAILVTSVNAQSGKIQELISELKEAKSKVDKSCI